MTRQYWVKEIEGRRRWWPLLVKIEWDPLEAADEGGATDGDVEMLMVQAAGEAGKSRPRRKKSQALGA